MPRLAIAFALLIVGNVLADDAADEQKKFAGTWKVKEGSADGLALPGEARAASRIVFEGNKFTFKGLPIEQTTTFTVDPAKGTIEIAPPKGETKTLRGRYRFEGATLSMVITDGDKFPEKIEGGKERLMLMLEKEK
jgi:uncharacterized protein (TIGR03067 family)